MSYGPLLGALGSGIFGSIFGKSPKVNPYADKIRQQADALGEQARMYGMLAQGNNRDYNEFNPQYKQAVQSEANYLATDPYTDQYSTQVLGAANQGVNEDFDRASSHLATTLGRRGLTGGGYDVGTNAALETARAGHLAQSQNQLARDKVTNMEQRRAGLVGMLGNVAGGYRTAGLQDMEGQTNATQGAAGLYGGLNSAANQIAQQEAAQQNEAIGAVGNALGQYVGGLGAKAQAAPKESPLTPGYSADGITVGDSGYPTLSTGLPTVNTDIGNYDPLAGQPTRAQKPPVNPSMAYLLNAGKGGYSYG